MTNEEIAQNISTLIKTFNDKRVISAGDLKEVLAAIMAILAANKKAVDTLALETKETANVLLEQASQTLTEATQTHISSVLKALQADYDTFATLLKKSSNFAKSDIEKATKEQNARAFIRLQALIDNLKLPQDGKDGKDAVGIPGKDGKDGSPDTAPEVRDKLERLEDDDRLDASAIKNLDKFFGRIRKKGKDMLVGGIRFFENLADVSIIVTKKRQDLLAQYNTTNNRWENGIALTVSLIAPSSPQENDVWIDLA